MAQSSQRKAINVGNGIRLWQLVLLPLYRGSGRGSGESGDSPREGKPLPGAAPSQSLRAPPAAARTLGRARVCREKSDLSPHA